MDEPEPFVRCRCGFTATGPSQSENLDTYANHCCPQTGWEWFVSHLFSFEGSLTVIGVAAILAAIAGILSPSR